MPHIRIGSPECLLMALCGQLRDATGVRGPAAFWQEGMRGYLPSYQPQHPNLTTLAGADAAVEEHTHPCPRAAAGTVSYECTQQQEAMAQQELYNRQGYWGLPTALRLRMLCTLCHDLLHTPLLR